MQIVKEKLEIDEVLEKKINNLLKFNECEDVYINDLSRSILLKELEHFIKCTF